jgi:hypothetical protein
MADPERTADVGKRDGCHLIVKFGSHGSDEDTAEASKGLDIHESATSLRNRNGGGTETSLLLLVRMPETQIDPRRAKTTSSGRMVGVVLERD